MLALAGAALSFTPGLTPPKASNAVVSRRDFFTNAAGFAAAATFVAPAFADGANSATTAFRARSIYGSRIYKLKGASTEKILEEKNAFTLFTSGTYRTIDAKATKKELNAIEKKVLAAAEAGDSAKAQALIGDFLKVAEIDRDYTAVAGSNFTPEQRRNAGAPGTFEIEDQMGTMKFALYKATDGSPVVNKGS